MTYEQWMQRPVYVAQCKTWKVAARLNLCSLGIRRARGHRDQFDQAARDLVASTVLLDRLQARIDAMEMQ